MEIIKQTSHVFSSVPGIYSQSYHIYSDFNKFTSKLLNRVLFAVNVKK